MYLFLIFSFIQLHVIYSDFNITDSSHKIRYILEKYKSNRRCRRCVDLGKGFNFDSFVDKSVDFFERTERYGNFLKYVNVSDCSRSASDIKSDYSREHITNGLVVHENVSDLHWEEYKSVYKKNYKTVHHEATALEKWRQNLRKVANHNKRYMEGKLSYSLHLNHFGDLNRLFNARMRRAQDMFITLTDGVTPAKSTADTFFYYPKRINIEMCKVHKHVSDYFRKILKLMPTLNLFDPAEDHHKTTFRRSSNHSVPRKLDWRSKGFKPRREEQWQCGACYAFAVTHAVQAQLFKKHGQWHELSPQQIVDCSIQDGNMGCDGGSLRSALRYASRVGLISEANYPYVGKRGRCKYWRAAARARPLRWATLPRDDAAVERALVAIGPLAVAVNAAPFTFQLYRSGIYDDPFCTPWTMNHAMLLVGYTPDYWVLLNWWGRNWGEDGYMRIRRGFNRCGVANMATYVEL